MFPVKIFKKDWPLIFGLVLTVSLLWPLVAAPFFTHHDDIQVIRLYEMDRCIKDHQIPCRWVPDLGNLYGYPLFNYYGPLPYYFGEGIYLLTNNLIFSVKVMFGFSFVGSYLFMYLLARKFWGKLGGSLSAIFYSLAPYHALDFYVRGEMGELWGLMFFPAIFWALTKLEEKESISNLLLTSIFIALLMTSHNLSTMIFSPLTITWIGLLFLRRKSVKFLWFSLSSFIMAILLSSFYFLPMVFEKNFVHVDTTTVGYFSYTEHFKGFKKLFLDRSWGYGNSIREIPGSEKDGLSYQIGWIHLLGWTAALVSAGFLWSNRKSFENKWLSAVIISVSLLTGFSIFMVNPRSTVIWQAIEPLKYIQFPWRFLLLIIFLISFVSGSLFLLRDIKRKNLIWVLLVIAVIAANFLYFQPEKFIQITSEQLMTGKNWEKQIKRSIFDFLPISAKEPPAELASRRYQILTGDTKVYDFREGSDWIDFKTQTLTHSIIRLSQYYFPDWRLFIDGKETTIDYKNNSLGLMTFILGKGSHEISARLFDTPIRVVANLMTLMGFAISLALFVMSFSRVRKWLSYYKKGIS